MRFKTPTAAKVTISADDNTTAIVGPQFAELDEKFHKDAMAHDLIAEDADDESGKPVPGQTTKAKRK